ncbi:MAG: PDZ domain-containing protein [Myxococcales bacterium]|nr:PDZ domain-containing protein [Myxococcales bacterium]
MHSARLPAALVGLALALALALAGGGGVAPAAAEVEGAPRVWLGISFDDQGGIAYVTDVHPGTGAAAGGLLPGDQIFAIDGRPLSAPGGLPGLVGAAQIGQRIEVMVVRNNRPLRLTPRLTARPPTEEIVYQRFIDRALPAVALFDRHGVAVAATEWARRPQVWVVFDARCEGCADAAVRLRARLADAPGDGPRPALRVVVLGQHVELQALLSRVPILGTVWRGDRGEDFTVVRRFVASAVDPGHDGVVLVVDPRGVVRFATSLSAGPAGHDGACATAERVARAWRP